MSLRKKTIPIWAVILLVIAATSIAAASTLAITTLAPEKMNLLDGSTISTDFTVTYTTSATGKNTITLTLTVKNTDDTNAHSGSVTVQLLDANGDVVAISGTEMDQTQTITDLAAGASKL